MANDHESKPTEKLPKTGIRHDAGVRQLRFIGRVVVNGMRWARKLADGVLWVLAIVLLTVGVAVGGVLLHRSALFLGVFGGLLLLMLLFEGAYRAWDEADKQVEATEARITELQSQRPRLNLHVGGLVFSERDHQAFLQLTVRVRNEGTPSAVYRWRLSAELAGKTYEARHVVGETPVQDSLDLPMLDKAIGNTSVATEITGLLQFSMPGISQNQLEGVDQLVLSASDDRGGQLQTVVDLPTLRAEKIKTVKVRGAC